jgi:hypothetical protein
MKVGVESFAAYRFTPKLMEWVVSGHLEDEKISN